jgi:pectate lyase
MRAFPGAEGFGQYSRGGRGGRVIKVTNLEDNGPGSLREAIAGRGPRTVVFEVSGIIDLQRDLDIRRGELTIAGQTAPGDGITLRGRALTVNADDVIIRYLRARPGDAAGAELDAISVRKGKNIIIDHCSTSWATDETLTIGASRFDTPRLIDNVTVQWSIISESLNLSVHSKGEHGYGTLLRGDSGARFSMHHNLWAHHKARMPRPGNYLDRDVDPIGPLFDIRNNVFYNWAGSYSGYNADTDSIARYNFVGNYYLEGPSSRAAIAFDESNPYASMYFANNWMNGKPVEGAMSIVRMPVNGALALREHAHESRVTEAADVAFRSVLEHAGASLARDAVDRRIVKEVRTRSGKIIDGVDEVGGWPVHESTPAPPDADNDGMPDEWETRSGLDRNDPSDGAIDPDGDGYTNLEDYLNSLVQ